MPFLPKASLLGLICAAACGAAGAQTLSLPQAYSAALSQDAVLQASRAAAQSGREALPQARSRLLPSVSGSASRSRNELDRSSSGPDGPLASSHEQYLSGSTGVSLRQPLYRPYEWRNVEQARVRVAESEALLEQDLQSLAVRVSEAYFNVLLAEDQIALVASQRSAYATQLDAARKSLAAGSGTRTDIDEVRARLDLNTADELQARQALLVAQRQLRTLMREPFDRVAPLNVGAMDLVAPAAAELDAWIARAEQNSPEIRVQQARVEQARLEIKKSDAGHLPTLDAVGGWSRSQSDSIERIGSRYTSKTVGLQLTVPLYSGGAISSAVRQAIAEEARATETLEALRQDLGVRVYRQFAGVAEGVLRIRALEQAVRSAEQMVLSNRKSFSAGSRTTVDVLNAEQQRVSALRDLAQARYNYLLSGVRLTVLAGAFDARQFDDINRFFTTALAGPAPLQQQSESHPTAQGGQEPALRRLQILPDAFSSIPNQSSLIQK